MVTDGCMIVTFFMTIQHCAECGDSIRAGLCRLALYMSVVYITLKVFGVN